MTDLLVTAIRTLGVEYVRHLLSEDGWSPDAVNALAEWQERCQRAREAAAVAAGGLGAQARRLRDRQPLCTVRCGRGHVCAYIYRTAEGRILWPIMEPPMSREARVELVQSGSAERRRDPAPLVAFGGLDVDGQQRLHSWATLIETPPAELLARGGDDPVAIWCRCGVWQADRQAMRSIIDKGDRKCMGAPRRVAASVRHG